MPWNIIIIVGVLVGLGVVLSYLNREIWFHEGANFGPRVQAWLYDRWARNYDDNKREAQANDTQQLALPLIERINEAGMTQPLMLDVATGTGRLPVALFGVGFEGHIVALDLSPAMLQQAHDKLTAHHTHIDFIAHSALELPFEDATFDVVSCLEGLVIMPELDKPLAEIARVLRPGGLLLTSRSTEAYASTNDLISSEEITGLLKGHGFEEIVITPWWERFDRVFARKVGDYTPAANKTLYEVLCCPNCQRTDIDASYVCQHCGHGVQKKHGIYNP